MKAGWAAKRFGDVLEIINGRNQREVESDQGRYPILGSAGKIMGYATDHLCEAGTTIIGRKGTINNPIYSEVRFWNVDTAFGLAPKSCLESKFLYYFCISYDFSLHNRGTTIPSLVKTDLLDIVIPLPPLEEQRRIVGVLDRALDAIAKAAAIAERALSLTNSIVSAAVDEALRDAVSGSYAQTLDELCELIVDCEHKTAPLSPSNIASIRTPNIGFGELLLDNVNTISEETFSVWTRRAVPTAGDLIFAREAPAGNIAVVPDGLRCALGQRTVLLRPNKIKVDPQFLASYLLHSTTQQRLLSHSTGATVQHINLKDIRGLKIEKLPPLADQKELVNNLTQIREKVRRAIHLRNQRISQLTALRQAFLQRAFSGELNSQSIDAEAA